MSDIKMAMMMAVGKALDLKKKNPDTETEEVMQHVMKTIKAVGKAKVAAIAAATKALELLDKNPKANQKEVMQQVMDESDEMLELIEESRE